MDIDFNEGIKNFNLNKNKIMYESLIIENLPPIDEMSHNVSDFNKILNLAF